MTPEQTQFLDAFPIWLKRLPEDVRALALRLNEGSVDPEVARKLAGALNYLFRSLDLIPDGIEELGFVDDAFVLRVTAAKLGSSAAPAEQDVVRRLGEEAELIRAFLEDDYARLERFVSGFDTLAVRGRSVEAIVADASVREEFLGELESWAKSFEPPSFARDVRNLTKLKAFLHTKLAKHGAPN